MLKKTITYTDYDGNQRIEDCYFNLSRAELTKMRLSYTGGLEKTLEKIAAEQDAKRMYEHFEDLILRSYGKKSLDGKQFEKSPEMSIAFQQTEAYSELVVELLSDANAAAAFVNGITSFPQDHLPKIAAVPNTTN
ncbi:hypothetical protein [Bacteroides sp.]|uniref:hypothetical protein n=1 Tax=Bacteroides sp. TaxID=29523 RepID=UPI002631CE68|nr:hypothetical protein [Bacteroides sp.]MDD3040078.1 hypothetical protein [Bacteroides sp.]